MSLISKQNLTTMLQFVGDLIEVDRATGTIPGNSDEQFSVARLVVQRVASAAHEIFPAGTVGFLEAVALLGVCVLVHDRCGHRDPRLPAYLKLIANESDFEAKHEHPRVERVLQHQADLRGAIRYIAAQLHSKDSSNREARQSRRRTE